MNGWYKLTEAFAEATWQNAALVLWKDLSTVVQENGALKDSHKSIRTALLNSARYRMKLKRLNRHQHNYINLLHEVIKAPDKVQCVRIGLAFAAGMVAMSLIASWYVSL